MRASALVLLCVLHASPLFAAPELASQFGDDFVIENAFPGADFNRPTQVAFLPDGRALVIEQRGMVWMIVDDTQLATPFLDLRDEVLDSQDRGLLGVAIDPDYQTAPWVYFSYTVDPNEDGFDVEEQAFSRVTRYRADAGDPNVAGLSTRQVLIGETWPEGIPSLSPSHTIGALRFAHDGSLLVASGDGAQFTGVDAGGRDAPGFGPGKCDPAEDLGAFRAQTLNSLCGKILRIDKDTGFGLSSNPYWNSVPTSDRSRVWLYGVRNPFRFSVRPPDSGSGGAAGTTVGPLYIGDVGWRTFEELAIATIPGSNLGWPCHEGVDAVSEYQAVTETEAGNTNVLCGAVQSAENPLSTTPTPPDLWWHHEQGNQSNPPGWTGASAIGGAFSTGATYPAELRDRYFLADFVGGWIRVVEVDDDNNIIGTQNFISVAGGPIDIEMNRITGELFYISMFSEEVRRIRYTGTDSIGDVGAPQAPALRLALPHPNPFLSATTVDLTTVESGPVLLRIYDAHGRYVRTIIDGSRAAGDHVAEWDGRSYTGGAVRSGVYFYRLDSAGNTVQQKAIRID